MIKMKLVVKHTSDNNETRREILTLLLSFIERERREHHRKKKKRPKEFITKNLKIVYCLGIRGWCPQISFLFFIFFT